MTVGFRDQSPQCLSPDNGGPPLNLYRNTLPEISRQQFSLDKRLDELKGKPFDHIALLQCPRRDIEGSYSIR
jgi:hypothetical protein